MRRADDVGGDRAGPQRRHYPSDVEAGAAIGMAATTLVRATPRLLIRAWGRPESWSRDRLLAG
ncbi:hypothetical protein AB0M38_25060 [Streptomyces sp. NPDC051742]|uniref:hypothetical protein n=1 Tax=unclassified Streptomyces TaxID=2593676 RepID=UPI003417B326